MPTQTLQEFNRTGLDNILLYVATTEPIFIPMLLFSVFMIVTLSTYFGSRKVFEDGDLPLSLATGSFMTLIVVVLLSQKSGLISATTFGISLTLVVIFTLFYVIKSMKS